MMRFAGPGAALSFTGHPTQPSTGCPGAVQHDACQEMHNYITAVLGHDIKSLVLTIELNQYATSSSV
jgi:hypothetical protein